MYTSTTRGNQKEHCNSSPEVPPAAVLYLFPSKEYNYLHFEVKGKNSLHEKNKLISFGAH